MNPVFVIVLAQLFGTSLWFSANSAADALLPQVLSWAVEQTAHTDAPHQ